MRNRRILLLSLMNLVELIIGLLGFGTLAQESTKRPHIVVILADDMGWNDVSFHGADQIPTPNIDALAYNGVILNRHYVLPICTPSRTSLMTGRYAIRDGMQGYPMQAGEKRGIPLNVTLMPEHMRRLDYETHLVGKWHTGFFTEDYTPARRGFDSFFGYYNGYIQYFNKTIGQTLDNGTIVTGKDLHRDESDAIAAASIDSSKYFTDQITDEAESIIRNNGNRKPLFLEIAHLAVHHSGSNVEGLETRNFSMVNETFDYIKDIDRRKYAGMMQAMDESVGRVVKALSEAQMLDNSIIIFMADNGAPTVDLFANVGSNYPLRGIKDTVFEGGVRGAACIFSPLIKASSRLSEEFVHISDWLPTLYSAAGGQVHDLGVIDGVDQWQSLREGSASPRQNMLVNIDEMRNFSSAIIGKHKLVQGAGSLDEYYGESGSDSSYPIYNVKDALSSTAGQAIKQLKAFVSPSAARARKLRERAIVRCERVANYSRCTNTCLFDIFNDPCETVDLSKQHPEMVKLLELYIDGYRSVLMPQRNDTGTAHPIDPCSFPQYFNGSWMPWRRNDADESTIIPASVCQRSVAMKA